MPGPRELARMQALGRAGAGAALLLAPRLVASAWVGSRTGSRAGTAVITSAMGARDLGLGLGAARAVSQGHGADAWIAAGVLADAVDLIATWRARHDLPTFGVAAVTLMAGGSTAVGLWVRGQVD